MLDLAELMEAACAVVVAWSLMERVLFHQQPRFLTFCDGVNVQSPKWREMLARRCCFLGDANRITSVLSSLSFNRLIHVISGACD